jgi:hypothetical protein
MDSIRGQCASNPPPRESIAMAKIIRLDHHAAYFTSRCKPRWIATARQLWFNGQLVKQFRRPAPWQELILAVFEELGWPEFIDDPLPGDKNIDAKRRLHDAIKLLNRHHLVRALSFHGDGSGQGVVWKHLDEKVSAPRSSPARP